MPGEFFFTTFARMQTDHSLLRKLADENDVKILPAGSVVLNFQAYVKSIPVVLRGHIKVVGEDENGNEFLLYYIRPGESCVMAILGALTGTSSKIKAITIEETEIIFIRPEKAARLVKEHPAWAEYIFKLYQNRFEELLQLVSNVQFKKTDDRIVDLRDKLTAGTLRLEPGEVLVGTELARDLGADYSWQSKVQYDIGQFPDTVQPAYGIWNASVAVTTPGHA